MIYGLTNSGFIVKPFNVILEEQKTAFRKIFGDDIDLSPESVAGAYCYNQAIKLAQLWELLGGLYGVADVNSADGIYLDRVGALVGATRMNSTKTRVRACVSGSVGTIIPVNHKVQDVNGNLFLSEKQIILGANSDFHDVSLEITLGSQYGFSIYYDDYETDISYTAQEGDTEADVYNALKTALEVVINDIETSFDPDTNIFKFWRSSGGEMKIMIDSTDTLSIDSIGIYSAYIANESGAIFVGINTLTDIVDTISGLDSITNYTAGETGTNIESDSDFRINIKFRQRNASGNEVAIKNAVEKVENVQFCKVYSNRTNSTDASGRPPHSFETVVTGGRDEDIAKTIFDTAPAGIQPYGTTQTTITDELGNIWTIGFSRPSDVTIYIKIKYSLNPEEIADANISQSIKSNIIEWQKDNLEVGTDLIRQKLYIPIYAVKGIKDVVIELSTNGTTYSESDITISDTQFAKISEQNITVIQVV